MQRETAMSVLGEVLNSLRLMTQLQLLLAFLACTGYALAQGKLIPAKGRRIAGSVAFVAAVGFAFESTEWMHAAMLLAFAVAGLGLFVATTWLISRALGLTARRVAPVAVDGDTSPAALPPPPRPRTPPSRKRPAHI
jgi:hypothetical protein